MSDIICRIVFNPFILLRAIFKLKLVCPQQEGVKSTFSHLSKQFLSHRVWLVLVLVTVLIGFFNLLTYLCFTVYITYSGCHGDSKCNTGCSTRYLIFIQDEYRMSWKVAVRGARMYGAIFWIRAFCDIIKWAKVLFFFFFFLILIHLYDWKISNNGLWIKDIMCVELL